MNIYRYSYNHIQQWCAVIILQHTGHAHSLLQTWRSFPAGLDLIGMAGVARRMNGEEMNGVAETREFAIEVRGVYKGYGSLRVLKGLDMSVPRGHM